MVNCKTIERFFCKWVGWIGFDSIDLWSIEWCSIYHFDFLSECFEAVVECRCCLILLFQKWKVLMACFGIICDVEIGVDDFVVGEMVE